MARLVAEEGLTLDVATGGELHVALHGRLPRAIDSCSTATTRATPRSQAARDAGVGRVVADSFDELDRLERLGFAGEVLVRVTPGVEAHTHEYIETGTERSKFGFSVVDRRRARRGAHGWSRPIALHFGGIHATSARRCSGSTRTRRPPAWSARSPTSASATTGVPVPLVEPRRWTRRALPRDRSGPRRSASTRPRCATALGDRPVMVEPGRSIVGRGRDHRVPGRHGEGDPPAARTYVAVDGGMSDNPRPVLYGAGYEAYLPGADRRAPSAGRVDRRASTASRVT